MALVFHALLLLLLKRFANRVKKEGGVVSLSLFGSRIRNF
jgi:hypothetical protein